MIFKKLNYAEPAVLRGIVLSVAALAGSIGVVNTDEITGAAEVWIPVVVTAIPIVQAVWTRFSVWSQRSVDRVAGKHEAPGV